MIISSIEYIFTIVSTSGTDMSIKSSKYKSNKNDKNEMKSESNDKKTQCNLLI